MGETPSSKAAWRPLIDPVASRRTVDQQIGHWFDQLIHKGIDKDLAMTPLGDREGVLSSDYGGRVAPKKGASSYHPGYDIRPTHGADSGTVNLYTPVSGRVLFEGWYNEKLGHTIIIGGDNGRMYILGHMQDGPQTYYRAAGSRIERGTLVGKMGQTGTATADCAHFVERRLGVSTSEPNRPCFNKDGTVMYNAVGQEWNNLRFHQSSGGEIVKFMAQHYDKGRIDFDDFTSVPPTIGWDPKPLKIGAPVPPRTMDQMLYSRNFREEHGVRPRADHLANDVAANARVGHSQVAAVATAAGIPPAPAAAPASGWSLSGTLSALGCSIGLTSCPAQAAPSKPRAR